MTTEDAIKPSGAALGRNPCVDDLEVGCSSQGRASSWLTGRCLYQKLEDCMCKALFYSGRHTFVWPSEDDERIGSIRISKRCGGQNRGHIAAVVLLKIPGQESHVCSSSYGTVT